MQVMKNYADMLTEIALIKEQIEITSEELEYWYGVDHQGKGIPLGGKGSYKYGANTSIVQAEKKINTLNRLNKKLSRLEYAKIRQDMLLEKFEGLEYKIAYKRIVENKTHKEIADDLGYSHQYMKEIWSKIKTYKEHTDRIEI